MFLASFISVFYTVKAQKGVLRQEITINHGWKFKVATGIEALTDANYSRDWEQVNIPHTFNAADAFDGIRGYYQGKGYYTKKLIINNLDTNSTDYFIRFKGCNHTARVFLNGNEIAKHEGGYTAFYVPINRTVKKGNNHLAVEIDNSYTKEVAPISADFTFYGGIYRDVELCTLPKNRFATDKAGSALSVKTVFANKDLAEIEILPSLSGNLKGLNLKLILKSSEGSVVYQVLKRIDAKKGTEGIKIKVPKPNLWTNESPYLYALEAQLAKADGSIMDEVSQKVGIRTFKFDPDSGFYLNGVQTKLYGANRHQDFAGIGNALTREYHRQDAHLLKEMGANFLRIAHYPQDDELLTACDELGILVWEEIPVVNEVGVNQNFTRTSLQQLREMITQHKHHPSVIIWGYMNEVLLKKGKNEEDIKKEEANALKLARSLDSLARTLDPSRYTAMALHNSDRYNTSGLADVPQVVGWNLYHGWYHDKNEDFGPFLDKEKKKYPKRNLIISEYGPGYDVRIKTSKPTRYDFSAQYGQDLHRSYFAQIMARTWVAGATVWNLVDFGSEGRKESMPHINNKGLVTMNRKPKDVFYFYKAALTKSPMVHIAMRDLPQVVVKVSATEKIKKIPIRVFSNCARVNLFLNDKPMGFEKIAGNFADFEIPVQREKTQIVAVGYNKENVIVAEDVFTIEVDFQTNILKSKLHNWKELRVNVGGHCMFHDPLTSTVWLDDQPYSEGSYGYVGGKPFVQDKRPGSQDLIIGSELTGVYQTRHDSLSEYRLDVADGDYIVELLFAELDKKAAKVLYDVGVNADAKQGEKPINKMEISLNGKIIISEFSPLEEAGPCGAIPLKFMAKAKEGQGLRFEFKALSGTTFLNGISISKQ